MREERGERREERGGRREERGVRGEERAASREERGERRDKSSGLRGEKGALMRCIKGSTLPGVDAVAHAGLDAPRAAPPLVRRRLGHPGVVARVELESNA